MLNLTAYLEDVFVKFFEDAGVVIEVPLAAERCVCIGQLTGQHERRLRHFQELLAILDLRRVFLRTRSNV